MPTGGSPRAPGFLKKMRKLAIFTAAFAIAAAGYVYLFSDAQVLWVTGACLALSVAGRYFYLRRISLFCLGVAVSLVWCSCYELTVMRKVNQLDQTEQEVTLQVMELPYQVQWRTAARCKMGDYYVLLYADNDLMEAEPGDTVQCTAQIERLTDSIRYCADGSFLRMNAQGPIKIKDGKPGVAQRMRLWLQGRIEALYEGQTAALVKALVTGDRYDLSYTTTNAFSVTGMSHSIAVSGMHVSILLAMVGLLCLRQPSITAIMGIPLIILFALMTGASPSVCRAAVMQIFMLAAPLVQRENDPLTTMSTAALVLLIQNPWTIASISFQLSFAAVIGLILFAGKMQKRLLGLSEKPGRIMRFLASGISATMSASITTIPLIMLYFKQVSIVAPIINLLALWAVTGIFTLGILSCIVGSAFVWLVSILARYVLWIVDFAAAFPYAAAFPVSLPLLVWAVLAYVVLAGILLFRRFPVRLPLCLLTAGFLVSIIWARMQFFAGPWKMTVLDVGQGQCMILRLGDYHAVIDCGGSDPEDAGELAVRVLHSAGITHIDALILTHYDADHAGGAPHFLNRLQVDTVYVPMANTERTLSEEIAVQTENLTCVTSMVQIETSGGTIRLYPPNLTDSSNNNGLSVLATSEEYDILITGDLDADAEAELLRTWPIPDIELLVAGHHGAKTSTSYYILSTLKPEIVVISAGADNSYGHPHEETLDRIQQIGAQVYRTDQSGTLYFYP